MKVGVHEDPGGSRWFQLGPGGSKRRSRRRVQEGSGGSRWGSRRIQVVPGWSRRVEVKVQVGTQGNPGGSRWVLEGPGGSRWGSNCSVVYFINLFGGCGQQRALLSWRLQKVSAEIII